MEYTPNFGKAFAATATLGLLLVLITVSGTAQSTSTNNLNVSVNISEKTIIDIQPSSFSWGFGGSGIEPGTLAGQNEELNGYGRIQVENLGSVNITEVWFNTTAPTERPFGTADRSLYDSGNFIQLSSNKSGAGALRDSNTFASRVEYGLNQPSGQDIIYLQTPTDWDYGRFRNGSYEYFWALEDNTGSGIGGATFRIGIDHHNSTQTGSTVLDSQCVGGDETGSANCNGYSLTSVSANGNTYGVSDVEVGVEDTTTASSDGGDNYCVAVDASTMESNADDPPRVEFIKWNKGSNIVQNAGGDCATVTQYLIGGGTSELAPGDWETMNIRANVPYGVVSGEVPTGQLTVLATSN